ncbi:hypothetical protein AOLI_G00238010 [Acnodon oligacanthus]
MTMSLSGKSTTTTPASQTSAERSSVDQSDRICDDVENFVIEAKVAMEMTICKVASSEVSPLPKNWKMTSGLLATEMLNILEAKLTHAQPEDVKSRETQVYRCITNPSSKAGTEILTDTLENLGTSSQETCSSSSSPLNDTEPVAVKKRSHRFNVFVGKKAPFICFGQKSIKACPAGMVSRNHQSDSNTGNQEFPVRADELETHRKSAKMN